MIKIFGRIFNVIWIASFMINVVYVITLIIIDEDVSDDYLVIFFGSIFIPLLLSSLLLNWGRINVYERFRRYIVEGKDFFGEIKTKDGE